MGVTMQICLAGVRGTVPVHTADFSGYGGATSCVLVRVAGQTFILDAGSGLRGDRFAAISPTLEFTMLISHAHVDHLMGFPVFSPFFNPACRGDIYLRTRNGRDARSQIEALMAPPLWPIRTDTLRAALQYHDLPARFAVGDVVVETMEIGHPGGCTAYKLSCHGVSLVYATDFEPTENETDFVAFARGCSLLLLDAQYTDEEYTRTRGFGHSTVTRSITLAEACQAEQTIFIHHDPGRTDTTLAAWDAALAAAHRPMHFGREGEEVLL